MSLLKKIDNDIKFAMKSKDALSLESLRAVKSSILLFKTKSGSSTNLSDQDEIKILQKLVKQRKDSAEIYKNQNRLELCDTELNQARIIESYLPKQLSPAEVSIITVSYTHLRAHETRHEIVCRLLL